MSFCVVPASSASGAPCSSADDHVEGEQPHRGGVDRHGRVGPGRAGCRRRAPACRRGARPARRPGRPRRRPARGRGRSRSGSAGRTPPTGRSAPWRGCAGTARCSPRPTSGRRRCASPTAGPARAADVRRIIRQSVLEVYCGNSRSAGEDPRCQLTDHADATRGAPGRPYAHMDAMTTSGDRRTRAAQGVRRHGRGRRRRPGGAPGRGVRAARAQRRRQDHHGGDPRGLPRARRRRGHACSAPTRPHADADWRSRVGIVLQGTGEFDELTVAEVVAPLRAASTRAPTTRTR